MVDNPMCNPKKAMKTEVWKLINPILSHQSDFSGNLCIFNQFYS